MVDLTKTGGDDEKSGKVVVSVKKSANVDREKDLFRAIVMHVIRAINIILICRFFLAIVMMALFFVIPKDQRPICLFFALEAQLLFQVMIHTFRTPQYKPTSNTKSGKAPHVFEYILVFLVLICAVGAWLAAILIPTCSTYHHLKYHIEEKLEYNQKVANFNINNHHTLTRSIWVLQGYFDVIRKSDIGIFWGLVAAAVCIANFFDLLYFVFLYVCLPLQNEHSKKPFDQIMFAAVQMKVIGSACLAWEKRSSKKSNKSKKNRASHKIEAV